MKMHLDNSPANLVSEYGPAGFTINRVLYTGDVVVTPDSVGEDWPAVSVKALTIEHFADILAAKPEIIVLGTGATHIFPAPRLMAELSALGCALEVMSTSAACRTYNVLVSESRVVTGILLKIND